MGAHGEAHRPRTRFTEWIVCGETSLRVLGRRVWDLSAYLNRCATDCEHDSAFAFSLPLTGVEIDSVAHGRTTIAAWVEASPASWMPRFRVPRPGYDPFTDATSCSLCRGAAAHVIVADGRYLPPFDADLFEAVRGCRVEIVIGAVS